MMGMNLLSELLAVPEQQGRFYGVTVGIVTNNKDDDGLGRVKVKFPLLSDSDESYWARVLTLMAGNDRGVYFLPEVDDEVLVAFAHGDIESPYILGAVWNGKDKPPEKNDDGKNNRRLIKSRSGHQIILDDTKDEEQIIIRDRTDKNEIVIDSKNNKLNIKVEEDITIEAKGKITIKSSDGDVLIEGKNLSFKAQQNCEIKADTNLKMQAQQSCEIKANTNCSVQANGGMTLKCAAGVNINDGALEVI